MRKMEVRRGNAKSALRSARSRKPTIDLAQTTTSLKSRNAAIDHAHFLSSLAEQSRLCPRSSNRPLHFGITPQNESVPRHVADFELLCAALYLARPAENIELFAAKAIARFRGFGNVLAASERDLTAIPGFRRAFLEILSIVKAAAVRLSQFEIQDRPILNDWQKLVGYLNVVLARETREQLRILFLDVRNHLILDETHSRGTVDYTPIYPREILQRALDLHATALILVHNHPSGDPTPSAEDISMTQKVFVAAQACSIALHDHIILGKNEQWFSFRRANLIPSPPDGNSPARV